MALTDDGGKPVAPQGRPGDAVAGRAFTFPCRSGKLAIGTAVGAHMEELLGILVVLAVLAGVLIGAVLGWVADSRSRRISRELEALRERVRWLETSGPAGPATAEAASPPPPTETPEAAEPARPADWPFGPPAGPLRPPPSAMEEPEEPAPAPEWPEEPVAARESSGTDDPAAAAPAGAPPPRDLEQALGGRWAVWVGGLALALGGVFLVRYSIEAGLLGPGARIVAGLLFALLLLGLGEWMRRREPVDLGPRFQGAYVPGILTAAGTVTAFATIFAAYALYGFIGDTAAFLALGAVAVATMALALVHGPALAGLGFAGSYLTPLLIETADPSLGGLCLYLVAVTGATLGLARIRGWRWLAAVGVLAAQLWALVLLLGGLLLGSDPADSVILAVYLAAVTVFAHLAFVASVHPADPGRPAPHDRWAVALMALFALPVIAHLAAFDTDGAGLALAIGFAAAAMVTAYEAPATRLLALAAILVVLAAYAGLDVSWRQVVDPATGVVRGPDVLELIREEEGGLLIGAGLLLGLLFGGLGLAGAAGSAARVQLAAAGATIPLGLLLLAWLRLEDFALVSVPFGFAALVLAGFLAVATEALARRLPPGEWGVDGAVSAYAVTAVAALVAGLGMMFERGVLTIALAAVVPAIAMVEARRPAAGLRHVAVAVSALVALRFLLDPEVVGSDLGTTPLFNWLLWGYGAPALFFGLAAWRFGRTREDRFVPVFEALSVVFTALTAVMLIHHAMNGGNIYGAVSGVAEQSLLSASLLAIALGMQWLAARRPSPVFRQGTLLVGAAGLLFAGGGLLVEQNPAFTGEPIDGGAFDGKLLLGYLLPAAMALAVARVAARRPDRPGWYVTGATALAGVLAFAWATLAVRAAFNTGDISYDFLFGPSIGEGELYAYSAVWLVAGVALLALGAALQSRATRVVAAALVLLVVAKVFLVDTAGLTGVLRAASFIGLGAVLVLVGLAYQRWLRHAA